VCSSSFSASAHPPALHSFPTRRSSDLVVWLAENGRERDLILVLIPGGHGRTPPSDDYSHLGFALASRAEVDSVAERARAEGRLRSEEHTSELQSLRHLVCRLLLEKKKK